MLKEFYEAVGVGNTRLLFRIPGRLHFAINLILVRIIDAIKGTNFLGGGYGRLLQDEIGVPVERANDYSASPRDLIKTLKSLEIKNTDSIMDMGCGEGLAMYYMSRFPFRMIGGIELSEKLSQEAEKNLKIIMKDFQRIKLVCADAGKWNHYDKFNFFYIYNSFPRQVIIEVIERLNESLEKNPRKIVVMYLYPEFADEFEKNDNFILLKKGTKKEIREGMHIYVNRAYCQEKVFK